jgi:hypothetical protein
MYGRVEAVDMLTRAVVRTERHRAPAARVGPAENRREAFGFVRWVVCLRFDDLTDSAENRTSMLSSGYECGGRVP